MIELSIKNDKSEDLDSYFSCTTSEQKQVSDVYYQKTQCFQNMRSLNERFYLEDITTFSLEEIEVLSDNDLWTVADLKNTEVFQLKGIRESTRESLSWAQNFYDLEKLNHRK